MLNTLDSSLSAMSDKEFLIWFFNRCKFKLGVEEHILNKLYALFKNNHIVPKKISSVQLDDMCKKYYADFDMEKSEDINWGYTDDERNKIRKFILGILSDFTEC